MVATWRRSETILLGDDGQRLGAPLQQRDQRLGVALLAIQLRQAFGGRRLRRITIDRDHQRARRAVRIAERRRPHVGRLRQPVARKRRITRRGADFFEQQRVRLGVTLTGVVSLRDRVLVVRILDQSLDQCLRFPRVHIVSDANTLTRKRQRDGLARDSVARCSEPAIVIARPPSRHAQHNATRSSLEATVTLVASALERGRRFGFRCDFLRGGSGERARCPDVVPLRRSQQAAAARFPKLAAAPPRTLHFAAAESACAGERS